MLVLPFPKRKDTLCYWRCWILTINLDLIVLQCLSSLIGGHAGISPSILLFSIENLQRTPTFKSIGQRKRGQKGWPNLIFFPPFGCLHRNAMTANLEVLGRCAPTQMGCRLWARWWEQRGRTGPHTAERWDCWEWLSPPQRNRQGLIQRWWEKLKKQHLFQLHSVSVSYWSQRFQSNFFWFIPRTLRLKCRLRSPALLDARQLYLPVSATWAPEIWRKRPWDKTWWRQSGTSRWPSFSHLMSGTGLPWKSQTGLNETAKKRRDHLENMWFKCWCIHLDIYPTPHRWEWCCISPWPSCPPLFPRAQCLVELLNWRGNQWGNFLLCHNLWKKLFLSYRSLKSLQRKSQTCKRTRSHVNRNTEVVPKLFKPFNNTNTPKHKIIIRFDLFYRGCRGQSSSSPPQLRLTRYRCTSQHPPPRRASVAGCGRLVINRASC